MSVEFTNIFSAAESARPPSPIPADKPNKYRYDEAAENVKKAEEDAYEKTKVAATEVAKKCLQTFIDQHKLTYTNKKVTFDSFTLWPTGSLRICFYVDGGIRYLFLQTENEQEQNIVVNFNQMEEARMKRQLDMPEKGKCSIM